MNIPDDLRAYFKRLSPYTGPNISPEAKERAEALWLDPNVPEEPPTWQWDSSSGDYQVELELCDLTETECIGDPWGYIAIRPLGHNQYLLMLNIEMDEELVFDSVQKAKTFLDSLLAAETPPLPPDPLIIPFRA